MRRRVLTLTVLWLASLPALAGEVPGYPWLAVGLAPESLAARFAPPPGYARVAAAPGGFAGWLRHLPLAPAGAPVRLYDGRLKPRQDVHAAVVEIDVGHRDLQQCADAVMRLRAEYLFQAGRAGEIGFDFTSGARATFSRWAEGWRPRVAGAHVDWRRSAAPDASHAALRRYLDTVFAYAGSSSLARELTPVPALAEIAIGDVFIHGGFPGHAVLVVDLAAAPDGRPLMLLAQSYMPAQAIHVLRNLGEPALDPWYAVGAGPALETPEWRFDWSELRRF